jgi:hypothetical protein
MNKRIKCRSNYNIKVGMNKKIRYMRNNFIGGMNNISIRCKNIGKKSNSSICKKMEWLNKCPKKLTYVSRCN